MKFLLTLTLCFLVARSSTIGEHRLRHEGVKIYVNNIEKAHDFYRNTLDLPFTKHSNRSILKDGQITIILEETSKKAIKSYPFEARTGLSLHVNKLLPAIEYLKRKNVIFHDSLLSRNGVGIAIPFEDISGNVIHLMEIQTYDAGKFEGIRVYNTGVTIPEIRKAEEFYKDILGFDDWSRNYLPDALPLKHSDNTFAFMLHQEDIRERSDAPHDAFPQMSLIFSYTNLEELQDFVRLKGYMSYLDKDVLIIKDPHGNWIQVVSN